MSPIPVPLPLLAYILAGTMLCTPLVLWWGGLSLAKAGWRRGGLRAWVLGLGWGGVLTIAGLAWLRFLIQTGNYQQIPITPGWRDALLLIVVTPIVEEPFYRGAVFGGLQRGWRPFWAVMLSAAVFTVGHATEPWLAFFFVTGIGYALAYRQSGSLLTPILARTLVAIAVLLGRVYPAFIGGLAPMTIWQAAGIAVIIVLLGSLNGQHQPD